MVNLKEIEKVIDNITDFISESVDEISDQEDYMVVIGVNMRGVMYYDKKKYSLYFAKYKKEAIKKYFNKNYPNLLVKKITSSYLTSD